jgi:hypothetical protein
MAQVVIDDRLIKKARAVTAIENDQEIVEAALEGLIFEVEAHREAIEIVKEMQKRPGYVGWDPEFAGWDKRAGSRMETGYSSSASRKGANPSSLGFTSKSRSSGRESPLCGSAKYAFVSSMKS